jgi:catechol 2,3-dioxygenase-like lactoylglutathione lyase family enzyme
MIGRRHHVVIDAPDPRGLAEFYSELLGLPLTYTSDDWVVIAENDRTSGFAFQLAPDHQRPAWPDPSRPQQFHLDVNG